MEMIIKEIEAKNVITKSNLPQPQLLGSSR